MLFIDQPELFYTINVVPGILYKNIPVTPLLGGALALSAVFVLSAKNKIVFIGGHFDKLIFSLFIIFWLPLYVNFFYNNFYDAVENMDYSSYSENGKRTVRFCNMDNRGGGEIACRMFSFIKLAENSLPAKSKVKILTASPFLNTYFNYYLFPRFSITSDINEADYLLYYFHNGYRYKDNILYKIEPDNRGEAREVKIGEYSLIDNMGPRRLILKKTEK